MVKIEVADAELGEGCGEAFCWGLSAVAGSGLASKLYVVAMR